MNGKPLIYHIDGRPRYIPVVLDYGYYALIEPKTLASVLVRGGVTPEPVAHLLGSEPSELFDETVPLVTRFARIIDSSGLLRSTFGRLLYRVESPVLMPSIWIDRSERQWKTIKERSYPPIQDQRRLNTIYPAYDEILFPQRFEEYHFVPQTADYAE